MARLNLIERQFAMTHQELQGLVDVGLVYHPQIKPSTPAAIQALRDAFASRLTKWDNDALKDKNVPFGKRRPLL